MRQIHIRRQNYFRKFLPGINIYPNLVAEKILTAFSFAKAKFCAPTNRFKIVYLSHMYAQLTERLILSFLFLELLKP